MLLPPSAAIQKDALPKTKSSTGIFHIVVADFSSLGCQEQLVSMLGDDAEA